MTIKGGNGFTTEQQVRRGFWDEHPQFVRNGRQEQNKYPHDVRAAFVDYLDTLRKEGTISEALAQKVTL